MIKKLAVFLFLLFKIGSTVYAADHVAGNSASMAVPADVPPMSRVTYQSVVYENAKKKKAVERVLDKYQSPMRQSLDTFFATCDSNDLDCYLLPAIAGLESGFGNYVLAGSYNPFGWGGGYIRFADWNEAIQTVGKGLRENYIGRGAQTIEQIGSLYAASPTWAARVRRYMAEFQAAEVQADFEVATAKLEL
jgi:hypothetical protein